MAARHGHKKSPEVPGWILQGFFEPTKELPLPCDSILRFQHVVIFIREVDESAFDSTKLGRLESFLSLTDWHAIVFSALDNQDWSVPFGDVIDRVELIVRPFRIFI